MPARKSASDGVRPSKSKLFAAAKARDFKTVAAILHAAPDLVRATDPKGRTALHIACAATAKSREDPNGLKTVAALLKAGAGLEAIVPMDEDEGDFRANPLWYAVARGENISLVRFLIKRGADASYSLWAAVSRDDAVLCRALLAAKPRLNLRAHGETPLFYAARLKRLKTLALLLDAGADPAIADDRGRDAVAIAQARRLPKEIVVRLERARQ
jgi:ankyrin repeat protein